MIKPTITKDSFLSLLKIKKSEEVEKFLAGLDIANSNENPLGHQYKWKPISNSLSNAANIENTTSSISPIIERIINAFDANIEVFPFKDASGESLPASPRKAIEKWFGVPYGDTSKQSTQMSIDDRTKMASLSKVQFYDSGDDSKPTIVIRDFGIGQHPTNFQSTFLRLGMSNKISAPHLHGVYGHGGSATLRFCDYTILISRKQKVALCGQDDLIGWTIIRKDSSMEIFLEADNAIVQIKKPPVYQYLCLTSDDIPYISPQEEIEFECGSYVAHISYYAKGWSNLSRGFGYRLFRNYLFDPVLPFRLEDLRPNFDDFNRNMFGARSTLLDSEDVAYSNEIEQYFTDGGKLRIRYWLLFDKNNPSKRPLTNYLERENSRNTIILTLNGQRHGTLEKTLISKDLRLSNLSQCLLIQIETDDLSRKMKAEIFTSNREAVVEQNDTIDLIREKLKESLDEDEELKEWERKLMIQVSKTSDDESKKTVRTILNRLIRVGIKPGSGGSQQVDVPGGTGTSIDYQPQDPPTILRFITNQDPIEIVQSKSKKINLEINGPDNYFTRRKNKGRLKHILSKQCGIHISYNARELKNGKLPITLIADENADVFNPNNIKFILEGEKLSTPLETERSLVVVPLPIFEPKDPPTELKILRTSPIKLNRGKTNGIIISMNGPDDIMDRNENKAEFFVECVHQKVHHVRTRKPKNGKMAISLAVDEDAQLDELLTITCILKLNNNIDLKDSIEAIISESITREVEDGGTTTVSLPNYDIVPIFREDWAQFSPAWDETSVGKFDMTRDQDDKDKLMLYVNADNENIINEINRREHKSQHTTAQSLKEKYIAYIGYHLYLVFENENEKNETTENNGDTVELKERSEEEKQEEYKRVSNTLVLSFQSITELPEDQD